MSDGVPTPLYTTAFIQFRFYISSRPIRVFHLLASYSCIPFPSTSFRFSTTIPFRCFICSYPIPVFFLFRYPLPVFHLLPPNSGFPSTPSPFRCGDMPYCWAFNRFQYKRNRRCRSLVGWIWRVVRRGVVEGGSLERTERGGDDYRFDCLIIRSHIGSWFMEA